MVPKLKIENLFPGIAKIYEISNEYCCFYWFKHFINHSTWEKEHGSTWEMLIKKLNYFGMITLDSNITWKIIFLFNFSNIKYHLFRNIADICFSSIFKILLFLYVPPTSGARYHSTSYNTNDSPAPLYHNDFLQWVEGVFL